MGLFAGKAEAVRCFNFIKQVYLQKVSMTEFE